jgi:hypothetical protein
VARVEGFSSGAKTGLKANVNAISDTVVSTVTLGQLETRPLWAVTDEDISNRYNASYMFARVGWETLAGVGTAGLANVKRGATALRVAGKVARLYDAAGNAMNVVGGVSDVLDQGITWQNSTEILSGAIGLRANFAEYRLVRDATKLGTPFGNRRLVNELEEDLLSQPGMHITPAPNMRGMLCLNPD